MDLCGQFFCAEFLPTGHHLFKSSTYPSSGLLETCSQVKAGSSPSCEFQDHCTLRSETSCVLWSLWCQSQFSAVPAKRLRKSSLSEWTESLLLFIHLSIHPSVYPSNHPISISQRAWLLGRQNISHAQCQASKRELTHVSCSLCVYVYICVCVHAKSLCCIWLFVTLWTVAHHTLLSMGFSTQEYCSGLPCPPPPGDLPNPGIKLSFLMPPALAGRFFTTSTTYN